MGNSNSSAGSLKRSKQILDGISDVNKTVTNTLNEVKETFETGGLNHIQEHVIQPMIDRSSSSTNSNTNTNSSNWVGLDSALSTTNDITHKDTGIQNSVVPSQISSGLLSQISSIYETPTNEITYSEIPDNTNLEAKTMVEAESTLKNEAPSEFRETTFGNRNNFGRGVSNQSRGGLNNFRRGVSNQSRRGLNNFRRGVSNQSRGGVSNRISQRTVSTSRLNRNKQSNVNQKNSNSRAAYYAP